MTVADKKLYYGKHYILAGGKADDSSDDVSESDAEELADDASKSEAQPAPSETNPPVSWHCLPIAVLENFIEAYNIKHVIDLAPTPLRLPITVLKLGCTYVGVTATPMMQTELKTQTKSRRTTQRKTGDNQTGSADPHNTGEGDNQTGSTDDPVPGHLNKLLNEARAAVASGNAPS